MPIFDRNFPCANHLHYPLCMPLHTGISTCGQFWEAVEANFCIRGYHFVTLCSWPSSMDLSSSVSVLQFLFITLQLLLSISHSLLLALWLFQTICFSLLVAIRFSQSVCRLALLLSVHHHLFPLFIPLFVFIAPCSSQSGGFSMFFTIRFLRTIPRHTFVPLVTVHDFPQFHFIARCWSHFACGHIIIARSVALSSFFSICCTIFVVLGLLPVVQYTLLVCLHRLFFNANYSMWLTFNSSPYLCCYRPCFISSSISFQ